MRYWPQAQSRSCSSATSRWQMSCAPSRRSVTWPRSAPRTRASRGRACGGEGGARVRRVEAALAAAPDTPEYADLRVRLALIKGVLQFHLNDAFNARLWQGERRAEEPGF